MAKNNIHGTPRELRQSRYGVDFGYLRSLIVLGEDPRSLRRGFTIVELLIVVVVIGILAAITIVAYNGISTRAIDTTMKSDLSNAAKLVELFQTTNSGYPSAASEINNGQGLQASGGNTLNYETKIYGYCVSAVNSRGSGPVRFKSNEGIISNGTCEATVSTFAGTGTLGYLDGPGATAQFNTLTGIAVDSSGTAYVADYGNHRIRKISPSGVVSTLAGSGVAGYADGAGTSAQFNYPYGIAVDSAGTVYVGDASNNRIRKITPGGVVSTLAGSGTNGYVDATGTAAQFSQPYGVAVDSAGTVYVGDTLNNRIRKITPGGVVSTLAGSGASAYADGTGAAAAFSFPNGLAISSSGTIYVADRDNHRIRKITPGGVVSTLAGSGVAGYADGTGTAARFNTPRGIAVDSTGTAYVADESTQRTRKITPTGVVSTLAGTGASGSADGTGTAAQFYHPTGIAVDNSGTVYIAEYVNRRVRKIVQ